MKIRVELSRKAFMRFGLFDLLVHRRQWRGPCIFACILCLCGTVCLFRRQVAGAGLLGGILWGAGLGLPAVYFLSFYLSLRKQAAERGLTRPQYVYTVTLTPEAEGIRVDNGREQASYRWDQIYGIYRDTYGVYLYINPRRAFILPYTCLEEEPEALWALLEQQAPGKRRR